MGFRALTDDRVPPAGPSLGQGLALHRAGRLREAGAVYGYLLKRNPRQPDALHLLGLVLHQLGDHKGAEPMIQAAIGLSPRSPAYRSNLGMVLKALGRTDEAIGSFRTAVRLDPLYADALANLGGTLSWERHKVAARRLLQRACVLEPAHDAAWTSLGSMNRAVERVGSSVPAHRRALVIQPFQAARRLNLGASLIEDDRFDEARRHLTRAAVLDPSLPEAWNHLGYLCLGRLELGQADRLVGRAILLRPAYAAAWAGRAETAFVAGDVTAAIGYSRRAVEIEPGNAQLRFRLGIHRLASGDIGGWVDHDALWLKPNAIQRLAAPPHWAGEPLDGKTLLITADQGVGDELLFSCCFSDAIRAARRVVVECDKRLVTLFQRTFPSALVHRYVRGGTKARMLQRYDWVPPEYKPDWMIEAGALFRWFRPTVQALDAAGGPWLVPDPERVAAMRAALDRLGPGPKVGVSWRSMTLSEFRNVHYPGLAALLPVLRVPGVTFVCLQYGPGWEEELKAIDAPVVAIPGLDTRWDIEGVTALAAALDLVICPSSTVGWIGAGVGAPVWLLYNTPTFIELGTDRFPGFPSIRPYRKTQLDPWDPLIARCAGDLAAWAASRGG